MMFLGSCSFFLYQFLSLKSVRNKTCRTYCQRNDEKELAKIFCRFADDYLLLDVPGAGTPEIMNCCHGVKPIIPDYLEKLK